MIEVKGYTEEQLEYLVDNYNSKTVKELACILGKSYNSISRTIHKLGLVKQIHHSWTDEEIEFLKEHYIDMTSEEMAKYINHSVHAINTKRDRLKLVRNASWTDAEVKFITDNYLTMSHADIGKALNRTRGAITAKCFELDLYKKEVPWTQEELDYLTENYMELPIAEISEKLGRTYTAIRCRAGKLGLKKSPYICNYHYFDNIDTGEKAYWLGFITADGWVSLRENENGGVVGIELQYRDKTHLKKFNKAIEGNYRITDKWKTCSLSSNGKKNHICCIRVFSIVMYNDLAKLGVTNQKTYNASIPDIPKDLIRHYIRGYFDGDGCFGFTNKSFGIKMLSASQRLIEDIAGILLDNNIHYSPYSYVTEYQTTIYVLYIYSLKDKLRFLDWIYSDCSIYLDRKYKKYLKVKEKYGIEEVRPAS